jgi:aryl-alcohol dehydrogenase-like predicted oxidoreductase
MTRSESIRLLEAAIDCGVTYFDLARSYSWGRAEAIFGALLPRHRDRLIIASKAGILPPKRSILRRIGSRTIRTLHNIVPSFKGYISAPDVWTLRDGVFAPADLRTSLETSLLKLRTDYLDIFLLHECKPTDTAQPELFDFLEKIKKEGKIRQFGLATGIDETLSILETRPALAPVVQIPNNMWQANVARLPPKVDRLTITHSCFKGRFRELLHRLASEETFAHEWETMTKVNPRDRTAVGQLFLAHALDCNPNGIVLFSSSKATNVTANVKVVTDMIIDPSQIQAANDFIREKWSEARY